MQNLKNVPYWPVLTTIALLEVGFGVCVRRLGGQDLLLDTVMTGPGAVQIIGEMSPEQRTAHIWMTLTLDSLLPLAYGFFLIMFAVKTHSHKALLLLPVVAVACDYTENVSQLLGLRGDDSALWIKSIATPTKFAAIVASFISSITMKLRSRRRGGPGALG